jgi:hypothetical protein
MGLKSSDIVVRDGENVKPEKTESNKETTRYKERQSYVELQSRYTASHIMALWHRGR